MFPWFFACRPLGPTPSIACRTFHFNTGGQVTKKGYRILEYGRENRRLWS